MSLYRQEKFVEKLLKFRWKRFGFDLIRIECYDRFDGDKLMCRLEVFKGGKGIKHRLMKYEAHLDNSFVKTAENKLLTLIVQKEMDGKS